MSITPEIPPFERSRYYSELGRFISIYSIAEAALRGVLQRTAGIDEPTSLAIFSGTRTDQASSFIRRCYEAKGEKIPQELADLLQQMAIITNLRNDLVHHGIDFTTAPPTANNRRSALSARAIRQTVVTERVLESASWDCGRLVLGFFTYVFPDADSDEKILSDRAFAVRTPWHYIPQQPSNRRPAGPRENRPKRIPRLPPSSQ